MIGDALLDDLGDQLEGSFGSVPGSDSDAAATFDALRRRRGSPASARSAARATTRRR
jgi:branched-chain amino acid transport system substrate-binding protein